MNVMATPTLDSFTNFAARLGIGTSNLSSAGGYSLNPITRSRLDLEYAYRGSWIVRAIVNCPSEDMTRAGVDIDGKIDPTDIDVMTREAKKLRVWQSLGEWNKWARLYGGSIGVLMIDGQDMAKPLRIDTVGKGQFRGILPLDRWLLEPSFNDRITEFGPTLGMPKFYQILARSAALPDMTVHHSRIIRREGDVLPHLQRMTENGWGMSVLESVYDRLINFDSATVGMAQLVYKAHLRTLKIQGLRAMLGTGSKAMQTALFSQINAIRMLQSTEGLTLLDGEDEFDTHQYSFAGLSDVLEQLGQQLSGACGIPLVRLFGQSPAGLNSTGDSDIRNYYDRIRAEQEATMLGAVTLIYDLIYRSVKGTAPPPDFQVSFRSLWQMSEAEKATIAGQTETAVSNAFSSGIIGQATALKELRQSAAVTGIFSNITDEDIEAAEEADKIPKMTPEEMQQAQNSVAPDPDENKSEPDEKTSSDTPNKDV